MTFAITDPHNLAEIEDTVKAADWQLTQGDLSAIEKLYAKRQEAIKIALSQVK